LGEEKSTLYIKKGGNVWKERTKMEVRGRSLRLVNSRGACRRNQGKEKTSEKYCPTKTTKRQKRGGRLFLRVHMGRFRGRFLRGGIGKKEDRGKKRGEKSKGEDFRRIEKAWLFGERGGTLGGGRESKTKEKEQ